MSLAVYERALRGGHGLRVQYSDGSEEPVPVRRWQGGLDAADEALLRRLGPPVLDVGCGPGRLTAALAARGVAALGVDIAPAAVRATRLRGGRAVRCDVFGPVPVGAGWRHVLLADGNIGIGGCPARLLGRVGRLAPSGQVHVEVAAPGAPTGHVQARLRCDRGTVGAWFPWARLAADAVAGPVAAAGLRVADTWTTGGRWFVELVPDGRATGPR